MSNSRIKVTGYIPVDDMAPGSVDKLGKVTPLGMSQLAVTAVDDLEDVQVEID